MSDVIPLSVQLAAAAAVAFGWLALARVVAARPPGEPGDARRRPAWWRWAAPAIEPLAALVAPALTAPRGAAIERRLRKAGLEGQIDASRWVAGRGLAALFAALAAAFGSACVATWGASAQAGAAALHWSQLPGLASPGATAIGAAVGWLLVGSWRADRGARRSRDVVRALPFFLDVIVLSVESGANLTGALAHAVAKGPPGPLRDEIERALDDVRTGRPRVDALRAMAERLDSPAVTSWVAALAAAERHGASLGPALRAQADQRRQERFAAAEERAMKAPVKMLLPLLAFVFPCTFVLLAFPIAVRLLEAGLLR